MSENPKESREQQNHLATLLGGLGGFAAVLTVIIYSFVHPLLTALAGGENTGGYWWLLIFEGMFVVISCFWLIALVSPNRKEHLVSLQEEHLRQHYQQRLGKILDRLSHWFSKDINKNQHPIAYYWSADLWGFTLLIAVLYPFLSLLIQWLISNQAAQLGGVVIFPAIEVGWQRLLMICLLLFSGFALYRLRQVVMNKDGNLAILVWTITFSFVLITVFSVALNNTPWLLLWIPLGIFLFWGSWLSFGYLLVCWTNLPEEDPSLFALLLVIVLVGAGSMAIASALALDIILDLALAFLLTLIGSVSLAIVRSGAVVGSIALAVALTIVGFVAGADVFAITGVIILLIVLPKASLFSNHRPMRLVLFNALPLLWLGLIFIVSIELNAVSRALLVFLGFLPIINAFFDYLSIGLTRYLLQKGLQSRFPALLGFADAIGAAFFFLLLKASLLTLFILLQDANGEPLLPLLGEQGLLQQIEQQPHDFYWLYFVLFSTLIPTILHLNLACFSLAVTSFAGLRRWLKGLAERLHQPNEDWIKTVFAFLQLVLFSTVMIVVPLWAFSHLWQSLVFLIWGEPDVLKQLLSWAESYAEWVAAFRE